MMFVLKRATTDVKAELVLLAGNDGADLDRLRVKLFSSAFRFPPKTAFVQAAMPRLDQNLLVRMRHGGLVDVRLPAQPDDALEEVCAAGGTVGMALYRSSEPDLKWVERSHSVQKYKL